MVFLPLKGVKSGGHDDGKGNLTSSQSAPLQAANHVPRVRRGVKVQTQRVENGQTSFRVLVQ